MNAGAHATLAYSWLLLIHQLPAKPAYLRVKIWRRLQDLGAVAVKNAVHALPMNDETQEDFEWLMREIVEGGGLDDLAERDVVECVRHGGGWDGECEEVANQGADTKTPPGAQGSGRRLNTAGTIERR